MDNKTNYTRDLWYKLYRLLSNYIDDYDNILDIEVIKFFKEYDPYFFIKIAPYEYIIITDSTKGTLDSKEIYNTFDKNFFIKNFGEQEDLSSGKYCFYTVASTKIKIKKLMVLIDISMTIRLLFGESANYLKPLIPPRDILDEFKINEEQMRSNKRK